MRTHEAGSRQWNRSLQRRPAPGPMTGGRGPDLPAVRFAPRPRDATPGSVLQDRF